MVFRNYVCLSILYSELIYKPDFTGRNSLLKLEAAQEATLCSRRGEEKPLPFTPKHTTPQPSQFPPGAEILVFPTNRDTPKAQPGTSNAKFHSHTSHPQPGAKRWARKSQSLAAGNKTFPRARARLPRAIPGCAIGPRVSWQNPRVSQPSVMPRSPL